MKITRDNEMKGFSLFFAAVVIILIFVSCFQTTCTVIARNIDYNLTL